MYDYLGHKSNSFMKSQKVIVLESSNCSWSEDLQESKMVLNDMSVFKSFTLYQHLNSVPLFSLHNFEQRKMKTKKERNSEKKK